MLYRTLVLIDTLYKYGYGVEEDVILAWYLPLIPFCFFLFANVTIMFVADE